MVNTGGKAEFAFFYYLFFGLFVPVCIECKKRICLLQWLPGLIFRDVIIVSDLRLELNELFGHFVVVSLRQNTQDCPARLVHMNASSKGQPARAGTLLNDVLELHNGDADKTIVPGEAIVFDAYM